MNGTWHEMNSTIGVDPLEESFSGRVVLVSTETEADKTEMPWHEELKTNVGLDDLLKRLGTRAHLNL